MHRHGATHQGHVRPGNQDAYYVGDQLVAVADGVGGAPAGEVAARIAIEQIKRLDGSVPADADETAAALEAVFHDAVAAIQADVAEHPERRGMATTLTAAVLRDRRLVLGHVGDSRAYLMRDGTLEQLTRDHTAVEEAVRAGRIERTAAARHPYRHMLVRAVGNDANVPVSTTAARVLRSGDRLLLCSDGLTEPCDDAVIAGLLTEADSVEDATSALVAEALQRGGPDNVTVVVVDVP